MFRELMLVTMAILFAIMMAASVVYEVVTGEYSNPPLPHSAEIKACLDAGGTPVMRYDWNQEVIVCQRDDRQK